MVGEEENESNGTNGSAYNAINMVRRRGYGKPIGAADPTVDLPAGLSKTDFFKAIVRERSLELGGEGVRKFDLIRWNLFASALSESKANMTKMSTSTVMINPSYMAAFPSYVLTTSLPVFMYYKNNSTLDDKTLWSNSFYTTAPAATPAG